MFTEIYVSSLCPPKETIQWEGNAYKRTRIPTHTAINNVQKGLLAANTYFATIVLNHNGVSVPFDSFRKWWDGWIVYESPPFYNKVHDERNYPSLKFLVLEKPRKWKPHAAD